MLVLEWPEVGQKLLDSFLLARVLPEVAIYCPVLYWEANWGRFASHTVGCGGGLKASGEREASSGEGRGQASHGRRRRRFASSFIFLGYVPRAVATYNITLLSGKSCFCSLLFQNKEILQQYMKILCLSSCIWLKTKLMWIWETNMASVHYSICYVLASGIPQQWHCQWFTTLLSKLLNSQECPSILSTTIYSRLSSFLQHPWNQQ